MPLVVNRPAPRFDRSWLIIDLSEAYLEKPVDGCPPIPES